MTNSSVKFKQKQKYFAFSVRCMNPSNFDLFLYDAIMQLSPYELLFSVFEEVCFSAESMSSSFVLLEADK